MLGSLASWKPPGTNENRRLLSSICPAVAAVSRELSSKQMSLQGKCLKWQSDCLFSWGRQKGTLGHDSGDLFQACSRMSKAVPWFPLLGERGARAATWRCWSKKRAVGDVGSVGHRRNANLCPPQQPPVLPPSAWRWRLAYEGSLSRKEKSLPRGCFSALSEVMHKLDSTSLVYSLTGFIKMLDHVMRERSGLQILASSLLQQGSGAYKQTTVLQDYTNLFLRSKNTHVLLVNPSWHETIAPVRRKKIPVLLQRSRVSSQKLPDAHFSHPS